MASPAVDQRSSAAAGAASTPPRQVDVAAAPSQQQQQHCSSPSQTSHSLHTRHPHDSVAGEEKVLADDDDLDPAAFLKSVRELSEKREREDNERFRKLEEEIEKGRQERIRRKEEHARSIAEKKEQQQQPHTPVSALRALQNPRAETPSSTTAHAGSPRPITPSSPRSPSRIAGDRSAMDGVPEFKGFGSIKRPSAPSSPSLSKPIADTSTPEAAKPSPSAAMPSRGGTVKWQQRPQSRGAGGSPSRPQSGFGSVRSERPQSRSKEDFEPSRDQIAASLGARDPSFFRQTADRGIGNAAYRRSKEDSDGSDSVISGRRGLPGMSKEGSTEPSRDMSPAPESVTSEDPSKLDSARESGAWSSRMSTTTSLSDQSKQSNDFSKPPTSVSDTASNADTEHTNTTLGRTPTMSSSQARLNSANEGPASPTKGMGGFVQSAMMKRSDSMNKRWSAQPGGSLSRQNSTASGYAGLQGSYSMPKLEPIGAGSREGSNEPSSRPTSSSSNLPDLARQGSQRTDGGFARPNLSHHHSRSKSVASTYMTNNTEQDGATSPPTSPSKRWSPNKSSWIESALAKPDSPRPASPTKNSQPSWMENIARAKAQRGSADSTPRVGTPVSAEPEPGRPRSPTKSTPFGPALLKRSDSRDLAPASSSTRSITPPTKSKPPSLSSRPTSMLTQESLDMAEKMATPTTREETGGFKKETSPKEDGSTTGVSDKPAPLYLGKTPSLSSTRQTPEIAPPKPDVRDKPLSMNPRNSPMPSSLRSKPDLANKAEATETPKSPIPSVSRSKPEPAPKPEPAKPVTDFRSTLKSRPPPQAKGTEQPEFLSKFGSLRKAQQEKYVAPDTFRENILRGKGDLAVTGGPQKTVRRDELKESLLAKKDQWKQEKEAGIVHERKTSGPPVTPSKPEALAKRELMGKPGSLKVNQPSPEKERQVTPEALRMRKEMKNKPKTEAPVVEKEEETEKPAALFSKRVPTPPSQSQEKPEETAPKQSISSPPAEVNPAPSQPEKRVISPPPAANETSKLANRFNPGLASMLARGPPSAGSPSGSRPESPAGIERMRSPPVSSPSEPPAAGAPLEDMRKGRAKGPKRRKGGAASADVRSPTVKPKPEAASVTEAEPSQPTTPAATEEPTIKPSTSVAVPGRSPDIGGPKSAASIMSASLGQAQKPAKSSKPAATLVSTASDEVPSPASAKPAPPSRASGVSAASIMSASLGSAQKPSHPDALAPRPLGSRPLPAAPKAGLSPKPSNSSLRSGSPSSTRELPSLPRRNFSSTSLSAEQPPATPRKDDVPEFKGFGSNLRPKSTAGPDEDKENANTSLPSVKDAASMWGMPTRLRSADKPSQITLPTKKDEEAAMRSAGLLASSPARSPSRPGSSSGPGPTSPGSPAAFAGAPPRPVKSSRIVSGQLRETSPNKSSSSPDKLPETEAERLLVSSFASWPTSNGPLTIDTQAVITACATTRPRSKTLRKTIYEVTADGVTKQLTPQQEYTLFDEGVYVCTHGHVAANGSKTAQLYTWAGVSSTRSAVEAATASAKAMARQEGSSLPVQAVTQGQEPSGFFEALGGILITRRGARQGAPKQFMLCGRKHLGHIVFDEVDFAVTSLCPAFVYLISYPLTLQETKLYLWKGSACSTEEIGAAKLAAMDMSETGEIIEVDNGAEFSSFLKVFGPTTTKSHVLKPTDMWKQKATAPDKFTSRLLRVQQAEVRTGLFAGMFSRRPSWGSRASPAPPDPTDVKAEAKEIKPFTQSDLDAEGVYLLDAYSSLFVLIGPLFASVQPETVRNALLAQALLFASDYAILSASMEDRPAIPKAMVVFSGVPENIRWLFRHWDGSKGLWGTGGLMAGSANPATMNEERVVPVDEVVRAVCR